jgi:membrane-bound lytic murein transglycosylase B
MFSFLMPTRFLSSFAAFALVASGPAEAEDFDSWKTSFRAQAIAAGISADTYDREMATVTPLERVLELNANQPEFTRSIWDYLDSAVSDKRVSNGLNNYNANLDLLNLIEASYGVDAETIVAIWGLESSYGAIQGNHDTLSALATLGHEGRRTSFGRTQLVGALKILDRSYADRTQLKGSWAGAMGQTQFIPTTYLDYAIDHDGDGRRDLWGNLGDVFASTANYLSRSGYTANEPWGFEVSLPADFEYAQAGRQNRRTVAEWASDGITRADTTPLTDNIDLNARASVLVPAGASGPAFIVFDNFRAILRYNNATSYALGIGLLSDQIAGRAKPLSKPWPRSDRALSLTERKALQQALTNKGYNPGGIDGIIGAGTRKALRQWQKDNNLPADGYASAAVLAKLQG